MLGNDLAGDKVVVDPLLTSTPCVDQPPDPIEQEIPDLYPSFAVTRAMAKKAKQNNGMQDISLADTLIGQSFNDEISNSLSPSQSDIQTDFEIPRSNTDLSPSVSNDQGHDQLSRSQLWKEQHSDPEISPLFERVLDENEMSQVPVCYYVKNDILMRKWRPPDVSADDEWTVNHQNVVPRAYRPEILNLAHETPMSGHLGVNKTCHTALHFGVKAKENQDKVPTLYWLPKLHKKPYKARFIANSSSCTTTELSKLLTSCLTAVKKHVIKYCEKVYERSGKNLFWSIKNSGEILDKLKARDFNATSLSTYDFSTLYTTLPHNLIKDKLIDLIENTFQREGSPYLACSDRNAFFTSEKPKKYHAWSCQNVCDALTFLLDNIFIRFGTKLYRQVVGIPMGTNCAPLVADLFLFCYERDFMMSLSDDKQADVIDAFNTTSRYLDDILNINNVYFDNMVSQIYPSELQLNKANASDTEAAFLGLHLSISNDIVSTKIYDKRDDFDFEIVNFPFLDGDVPRSTSYGVYISQLIRFARASSYVADFNTRNKLLTQKLLKQGYRYHKLRKTFSKFYRRYYDLISKFQVGLKSLLRQGLSEPDFYGDLVYKLKKIVGSNKFFSAVH